jgi:hypothetical protein
VALSLGIVVLVLAEIFHPSTEDPMDNPAAFMEYAHSNIWTADHLAEYFGFLLLLGGLVALYHWVSAKPGAGAGIAPFALAAVVTTAASYTVLQAVDGITLKRAVDAWASAPDAQKTAIFTAAETVRWTEIGMNSFSNLLTGPTLLLYGLAIALGTVYARWVGWGGCRFRSRVHVPRCGGGGLRELRPLDHQTGGHPSPGCVGVDHGRLDVVQR